MSVHVDIEAIDPDSLTPKQTIVYEALKRGKKPKTIARQMKITPAGVYGHMRALAAKTSPNGGAKTEANVTGTAEANGSAAKAEANTAAVSEPGSFETAVETVKQSLLAEREVVTADEEAIAHARRVIAEAQSQIEAVSDDVSHRKTRIQALESAAETLTVAV